MKRLLFSILIGLSVCRVYAMEDFVAQWVRDAAALGYTPETEVTDGNYTRLRMADSCYLDLVDYTDSLLVVRTVCAPVCSSVAMVYLSNGQIVRVIQPTIEGIFPLAHIENGVLFWTDNTTEILDDSERKKAENQ